MNHLYRETECTALLGSMTQALQAQAALTEASVCASVVKAEDVTKRRGCAYGVRFPCGYTPLVKKVLKNSGIRVRSYREASDDLFR